MLNVASPFAGRPITVGRGTQAPPISNTGGRIQPSINKKAFQWPPTGGGDGENGGGTIGDGGNGLPPIDTPPGTDPLNNGNGNDGETGNNANGGLGGGSLSGGATGGNSHGRHGVTPGYKNSIPIPMGNTGTPFLTPVTGPPTYQNISGQSGAYAGPFDYWGQGGASGNRQLAGGAVFGGNLEQLMHPGLDAGSKNALEQSAQGAINSQYAGQQEQLAERAAQSGNMAGVAGASALMARNKASALGQSAQQAKLAEDAIAQQQKESALQGLSQLYQGETGYMQNLLGGRAGLAQTPFQQNTYQQGVTTGTSGTSNFSI